LNSKKDDDARHLRHHLRCCWQVNLLKRPSNIIIQFSM
jgi:hypothetical protein